MSEAPPVLLPYQQRWVADKSQVQVIEKSRRIGISWAEAARCALLAASRGRKGMDVMYIGYNEKMTREWIKDVGDWARAYQLAAEEMEEDVIEELDKDILVFRIKFASGYKVEALSSKPSDLRGKQARIVADEAAFHHDLKELLKAAFAHLIWGGSVAIISSHNGDTNPFNELIQDVRAGRYPYSIHRVTLDEAIAEGLYERICLVQGMEWTKKGEEEWRKMLFNIYGEGATEELLVIPKGKAGAYLSRSLIESCMIDAPIVRLSLPDEFAQLPDIVRAEQVKDWIEKELAPLMVKLDPARSSWFGEDFGRNGDLTVIVPLQERQNLGKRAPFFVELRCVPFREQEQILFYIGDHLPRFAGGALDARGNGQYLAERAMQRWGSVIVQVALSKTWYLENMPPLKAAFEDGEIEIPKDADVLDDLRSLAMVKGIPRIPEARGKGQDGGQRHGDSAIALALAYFAARQESAPLEFRPIGQPRAVYKMDDFLL